MNDAARAVPDLPQEIDTDRFARCLSASRRVRWEIDGDVIRGRSLDPDHKFLANGLSFTAELDFLGEDERRHLSRIQGRTYANVLILMERFVDARSSAGRWMADPVAREALATFSDESRKHQELFRRLEAMMGDAMPEGYAFAWTPDELVGAGAGRSAWAVMALTLLIGLLAQAHALRSDPADDALSPLMRDALDFRWREEAQHTLLDELEWRRVDAGLNRPAREVAADDVVELIEAVDGLLRAQAEADVGYFARTVGRRLPEPEACAVRDTLLAAYRAQHLGFGMQHPRFQGVLCELATEDQRARIREALAAMGL